MKLRKLKPDEKILLGRKPRGPYENWTWEILTVKEAVENDRFSEKVGMMWYAWLIDDEGMLHQSVFLENGWPAVDKYEAHDLDEEINPYAKSYKRIREGWGHVNDFGLNWRRS